ncbi:glycosyltransferase family 8 protein [Helicobacter sp. MIT 05-5293]|nr:glycosyltransferase family 8 protein [Helicobacter sp. MIT 05-5293]
MAYLAVALESLKTHTHTSCYDIIILEIHLSEEQKRTILTHYTNDKISIRFLNLEREISLHRQTSYTTTYLSSAMYLRFFIPKILHQYQRAIYCDSDVIFCADIASLYDVDLGDNLLGVVKDTGVQVFHHLNDHFVSYAQNTLCLKNSQNYFQSGLLVFNIPQCLKENLCEQCLETLAHLESPIYPDQDVLNIVAEGKVAFLQGCWSVENHILVYEYFLSNLPAQELELYKQDLASVKILQYAGDMKPWSYPDTPNATLWWSYARNSPFYESIIYQNTVRVVPKIGAELRVKNTLSYSLGNAIIRAKNPLKVIILPLTLIKVYCAYKLRKKLYKMLTKLDSSYTLPPLESYADFDKSQKLKESLTYQLGDTLIKHPLTFPFLAPKIYRTYKE